MAYSTSNRPYQIVAAVAGGFNVGSSNSGGNVWAYRSTDPLNTVTGTSYFSDGHKLGMRVGDIVQIVEHTTAFVPSRLHAACVSAVTTGAGATAGVINSSST